jgi:hypothetical protein
MTKIPKGKLYGSLLDHNAFFMFRELGHWNLDIFSYFEFRVSNFRFNRFRTH